jgi:hypothetical protein
MSDRHDIFRINADAFLTVTAMHPLKHDNPFNFGEDCVVLAQANIYTGMEMGSTLANNDVTRDHIFAAEALNAEALCVTITSVFGGAATFFVCHC